jgi:ATP-binding cassette, subfamily B (MDR/TAP), member 1
MHPNSSTRFLLYSGKPRSTGLRPWLTDHSAVIIGLVYPFFAIALSSIIEIFSAPGPNLESDAKFWSLVFLLIGIAFLVLSFSQQFLFGLASSLLTERLRSCR